MKEKILRILDNYYHIIKDEKTAEELQKFIEMMLEYNKIHNLTSITDVDEVILKHLLDSVLPIGLLKETDRILDIGCGAGFPSVPLAIVNRNLNITAIDSVQKKTDFVGLVKNELKLDNLTVHHTRIEDFARLEGERESYDVVLSRAVAPLNVIVEYSAPMLKDGGYIFAYKGVNFEEEIKVAQKAFRILDCSFEDVTGFHIYELETNRYVIRIRKNSKIIPKYPRKQNKPRIKPL